MLGLVFIALSVNHDPLVLLKVDRVLDRKSSQRCLITVNDLVTLPNFRRAKSMSLHGLRFRTKLETPLFNTLLVEELFAHILNLLHLILRSDSSLCQSIAHASSLFDIVRYTIDKAELRRQVKVLVLVLNKEQRLLSISNYHIVMAIEVLSDTDIFTLVLEFHSHGI